MLDKNKSPQSDNEKSQNILVELLKRFRLAWQLFIDQRVPIWTKIVPLLSLAYLFWPIDLIPDAIIGLGQLDDIAIIMLGLTLFVKLCPPDVVQTHSDELGYEIPPDEDVIDGDYTVADDKE